MSRSPVIVTIGAGDRCALSHAVELVDILTELDALVTDTAGLPRRPRGVLLGEQLHRGYCESA